MDGNGRWAENRGLERVEGHRAGVDAVKTVIRCCMEKKIPVLSLFAFSSENWARPAMEVDFLMQLFSQALMREIKELHEQGVSVRFLGARAQLSASLSLEMDVAETLTAQNEGLVLNIALNYGGKWDILQATKTLASRVQQGLMTLDEIDEAVFGECLSTQGLPDPDLFIRTSGEQRISNFLLWQLAYTELYFSEVYWPSFTAVEFEEALEFFNTRKRRYGQTDKQLNETHDV